MAFAETGTFNINDGRNANKNYLLSSDSQSDGLCGVRNRANQPWMKTSTRRTAHTWKNMIHSSWLDVSLFSHLIGLHRFANENLLCDFSVCKSQYVYNNKNYYSVHNNNNNNNNNNNMREKQILTNVSINTQVIIQNRALSLARYLGLSADNHLRRTKWPPVVVLPL